MLVGGVYAILNVPEPGPGASPARPPATAAGPPVTDPPALPPPAVVTYRDFIFETDVVEAPTATKTQSKLWFAHGSWWGALFQPSTNQVNIFRLDWETQLWTDTGTLIDERSVADPDVLWSGEHLYVLTSGPNETRRNAARVLRYSYDAEGDRFTLDSNFPVTITETGHAASVITRDGTGRLWVAYVSAGRVWTVHSLEHDAIWSAPEELPVAGSRVDPEDIASITAFGPGLVGLMWSNQLEGRVYFSVHRDEDPADAWSDPEVVVEGADYADDHINLKSFQSGDRVEVVAAIKTSLDARSPINPLAPQILLALRDPDGAWTTHLVSRVRDKHTRAIVTVDEAAQMIYVAATASTGEIAYKRTSLDAVNFDVGRGLPLVASEVDQRISNASSTKQAVTAESGLVVIGSDNGTGRYLHGVLDLGGGLPSADPAAAGRPDRPDPPDPQSAITLIDNDFELWASGEATGTNWNVRDGDPPTSLSIAEDATGGRALRLKPGTGGTEVRACRPFPDRPGTTLSVELRVRVHGRSGSSDTTLLSLRGSGGEAASVRVTTRAEFAWYAGAVKERAGRFRSRTVYRVVATVDQQRRRFSFRILDADGTVLVRQSKLAWRSEEVPSVKSICLETTAGNPDQVVDLLDVSVLEEAPG